MRVKNWEKFQHYKDRRPPWIKLHRTLIDDVDFYELSGAAAKSLILFWIVASDVDGELPGVEALAFRLRLTTKAAEAAVDELFAAGFIEDSQGDEPAGNSPAWPSRHIPEKVKQAVFVRDNGRCMWCHGSANIEYDHKIPVSAGGKSVFENVQLLCRSCNRSKRAKMGKAAEQVATRKINLRSPETEKRQRKDRDREEIDAPVDHKYEYDGEKKTLTQQVVAVVMEAFGDWPQSEVEASVLKFHVADAGLTLDEWKDIADAAWKATPPKTPVRSYHQKLSWQMDFHLRQRKAKADGENRETPQQRERREQLEQAARWVREAEEEEEKNGDEKVHVSGVADFLGGIPKDKNDSGQASAVGGAPGRDK